MKFITDIRYENPFGWDGEGSTEADRYTGGGKPTDGARYGA